jgi:hypothetical protein
MANGWYGTHEEWERLEAPLKLLDPGLGSFAHTHGLTVTKNSKHGRPERSIIWGDDVRCLVQLFLASESVPTLNLWICASQDRDGNRYWKNEMLRREVQASDLVLELRDILEAGIRQLNQWSAHPDQLQFATELGKV